jgi:hypothetical protein
MESTLCGCDQGRYKVNTGGVYLLKLRVCVSVCS